MIRHFTEHSTAFRAARKSNKRVIGCRKTKTKFRRFSFAYLPVELKWLLTSVYPLNWLFVSKSFHTAAFNQLLRDPRVNPTKMTFSYRVRHSKELVESPIVWAATRGHAQLVRVLLKDNRVDPSVQNHQALVNACNHGHAEVVRLLLNDNRSDRREKRNLAIEVTCCTNNATLFCMLLNE